MKASQTFFFIQFEHLDFSDNEAEIDPDGKPDKQDGNKIVQKHGDNYLYEILDANQQDLVDVKGMLFPQRIAHLECIKISRTHR